MYHLSNWDDYNDDSDYFSQGLVVVVCLVCGTVGGQTREGETIDLAPENEAWRDTVKGDKLRYP